MFDIQKIRKDFPFLVKNKDLIYFDNAGTSLKPQCVIDKEVEYYTDYCANPHTGDNGISMKADNAVEEARRKVAKFINSEENEVFFTTNDTMSMNCIAYGLKPLLKKGDEVLITLAEHASNVLPWFRLKNEIGIEIKYIPLTQEGRISLENVKKSITNKTKIISLAHVTNVLGYIVDIKSIAKIAHSCGAIMIVDGAQSVPHIKVDVKDLDCDFMAFSAHKMCGPTGVGVVYGKFDLLNKMDPLIVGGGSNTRFYKDGEYSLLPPPKKFEAGTQNIAGIVATGAAVDYLMSIGMDNIEKREKELQEYLVKKMKGVPGVKFYNEDSDTGIVTFNYKDIFSQDMATHFNSYNIAIRSGQHCAKILSNHIETTATCRASLYFYNTKEEIDKFVEVLSKGDEFLDVFFK